MLAHERAMLFFERDEPVVDGQRVADDPEATTNKIEHRDQDLSDVHGPPRWIRHDAARAGAETRSYRSFCKYGRLNSQEPSPKQRQHGPEQQIALNHASSTRA